MVQIYTLVQTQTPPQLVGKIMAALISIAMCGQPIGQAIYGVLFDIFGSAYMGGFSWGCDSSIFDFFLFKEDIR